MKHALIAVALLATAGIATNAVANPIPIYNTGVASGGGLAANGSADAHWTVVSTPSSSTPSTAYVIANANAASGWKKDPASQWISANSGTSGRGVNGAYEYQTTFDLTGLKYATAQLTGQFAVDNCVTDILINGVSTGIHSPDSTGVCSSGSDYSAFLAFAINTGFVQGMNTLTFLVTNTGGASNPTGLNVQISGTALPAPEPATLGLLGLALLGLGGLWIRRRA